VGSGRSAATNDKEWGYASELLDRGSGARRRRIAGDRSAPRRGDEEGALQIAVTGATGKLGGRVARRLAEQGIAQRLIVRDARRAPRYPQSEVMVASYGDRDTLVHALEGVDVLLFVSASEAPDRLRQHFTFIDAAASAGVKHVVYTSFFAAAPDATFTLARDHWATEERLRSSGLAFTFLRDSLYLDFLPMMAGADGVIRGPAGRGKVAAVAQDDIADVAAAVLRHPEPHLGHAIRAGELERVTVDVERVAGHPAASLDELLTRSGY
jgi:NAD(P)H dehydrogenase (quinone)